MPSVVVVGAQWGDEGKGKIVDVLTRQADVVARYQGGHNAGHTVVVDRDEIILHLVPSGILHKGKLSCVGNGTVCEPKAFIEELDGLKALGIEPTRENLLLSVGAHLIMPYHLVLDGAIEAIRGKDRIGTTGRGIGPAYVDKAMRQGLKVGDLRYPELFREKVRKALAYHNRVIRDLLGLDPFDPDQVTDTYLGYAERLIPHMADVDIVINDALDAGRKVLFEGAQGTLLDIDHGTYPFVTSSSAIAGGVCTGLGVGPTKIDKVLGIVKAYTTRVGEGPFPTEQDNAFGEHLRARGKEYGATTGRPRRCGWLDMVALRHAVRVNGLTGLAITKLDVLDGLDELKVATAYEYKGERLTEFPKEASILWDCKPVYASHKGWGGSTAGSNDYSALPREARDYLSAIEGYLGTEIAMVSTGQRRDSLAVLREQF